jgi:hypothetical protein
MSAVFKANRHINDSRKFDAGYALGRIFLPAQKGLDSTKKTTPCQTESAKGQALAGWRGCGFNMVVIRKQRSIG